MPEQDPIGRSTGQALAARFGTAKHPDRAVVHARPAESDDATVAAVGKISAAFEVVENARGMLYAFHRMSGEADLTLQEGLAALREAGHIELAGQIDDVLVGRDVVRDMWTFQNVEAYDEQYWRVFQAVDQEVREQLSGGMPHVFEAEMKRQEQSGS
jgi:tRNA-dihydrouridine synthase